MIILFSVNHTTLSTMRWYLWIYQKIWSFNLKKNKENRASSVSNPATVIETQGKSLNIVYYIENYIEICIALKTHAFWGDQFLISHPATVEVIGFNYFHEHGIDEWVSRNICILTHKWESKHVAGILYWYSLNRIYK